MFKSILTWDHFFFVTYFQIKYILCKDISVILIYNFGLKNSIFQIVLLQTDIDQSLHEFFFRSQLKIV